MKTNERTAIPRLRFPEFQDDDSWREKKLIDVTNKDLKWSFIGGPFGSNLKASDYTNKGIRVIQLQNIGDGEFINDSKIYTSKEKANELLANNIYPHDIIMSKMGDPVGRASLIPDTHLRYVMCSDGIRLVVDEDKYSKYFVYSFINSDTFRASVESKSTGSTRKRIGLSHLKTLPLLIPTLAEQQRIADCLSSLDDSINAEIQQLNSLKTHKAGLLQNLFPVKDKTVPRYRFADFKEGEDWGESKLGKLSTIVRGGSPRPIIDYLTKDINGLNWLKIGDVDKEAKFITNTEEKVIKSALTKTRVVKPDDLIMSNSMSFGRPYILQIESCIHDGWIAITKIKTTINRDFLYYAILSGESQSYFLNLAAGSGVKNLNINIIDNLSLKFPDIKEQKEIADCLSSLDNLIESQANKIAMIKQHKQGLMQQLFPLMDDK